MLRFLMFETDKGKTATGIIEEDIIREITGNIFTGFKFTENIYNPEDIRFLPPCNPTKIVCIGTNYYKHAEEMGRAIPSVPRLFMKPTCALLGHGGNIIYPDWMSEHIDYEGELAVVIGREAYRVKEDCIFDYIFGYTCLNDITARDLQKIDGQFTRAKGFNTFAPIGPWIETSADPYSLEIITRVNGVIKQKANTSGQIFPVHKLVSFITQIMTLYPGDIIATGTPAGVGPLKKGDIVEVSIKGIGTLRNRVI